VLGAYVYNRRWDRRSTQWNAPIDWLDFRGAELHSGKITQTKRYLILLYYSLINLGLQELAPVNPNEYFFCMVSLVMSALLYTNIFSSIASLQAVMKL
jgi:hypothetical protein